MKRDKASFHLEIFVTPLSRHVHVQLCSITVNKTGSTWYFLLQRRRTKLHKNLSFILHNFPCCIISCFIKVKQKKPFVIIQFPSQCTVLALMCWPLTLILFCYLPQTPLPTSVFETVEAKTAFLK